MKNIAQVFLGSGTVKIPCNWSFLAKKATDNPVSVALHYKKLIHHVITILLGMNPATNTEGEKRTLTTNFGGWGRDTLGVILGT